MKTPPAPEPGWRRFHAGVAGKRQSPLRFCCRFTRFRVKTPESRVKRNRRIRKPSAETPQKPSSHVFGGLLERLEEAVRDGFGRGVPMRRVGIHLLGKGRNPRPAMPSAGFPHLPRTGQAAPPAKRRDVPAVRAMASASENFLPIHASAKQDIGWSQCFRALRLDLIRNPQVDFQKRTHGVRILFRERADPRQGVRAALHRNPANAPRL